MQLDPPFQGTGTKRYKPAHCTGCADRYTVHNPLGYVPAVPGTESAIAPKGKCTGSATKTTTESPTP